TTRRPSAHPASVTAFGNGAAAPVVGDVGGYVLELEAFVASLHHVAGATADGGVAIVLRAEPLVAQRVIGFGAGDDGAERLSFLRGAADRYRDAQRRVDHGAAGSGIGRGGAATVVGGVGGDDLEMVTFVSLLHHVARAAADRGGVIVLRAEPLIAQRVVALGAGDDGAEGLAFLRRPADRYRDARDLVDDRGGRIAGRRGCAAVVG